MTPLDELNLDASTLQHLSNATLRRLASYLNRWEHYQAALDCLDPHHPLTQVSLIDAQINALAGLGHYPEAIQLAETRLTQKDSNTARMNLANLYLESGDLETATAQLQEMAGKKRNY